MIEQNFAPRLTLIEIQGDLLTTDCGGENVFLRSNGLLATFFVGQFGRLRTHAVFILLFFSGSARLAVNLN